MYTFWAIYLPGIGRFAIAIGLVFLALRGAWFVRQGREVRRLRKRVNALESYSKKAQRVGTELTVYRSLDAMPIATREPVEAMIRALANGPDQSQENW